MKFYIFALFFGVVVYAKPHNLPLNVNGDQAKRLANEALVAYNKQSNDMFPYVLGKIVRAEALPFACTCYELELEIVRNKNCLKSEAQKCTKQPEKDEKVKKIQVKIEGRSPHRRHTFKEL